MMFSDDTARKLPSLAGFYNGQNGVRAVGEGDMGRDQAGGRNGRLADGEERSNGLCLMPFLSCRRRRSNHSFRAE
jgi:hypothetical protein